MYAFELFEADKPRVVVTYPGRFQPFHQGHAAVFAQLQKKFGNDNVFIITSNDTSGAKSPFSFSDKYRLMTSAGVPGDKIIETNNMYVLPEGIDPASTIFIAAVGEPDKKRLNPDTFIKKDKKDANGNIIKPAGSASYFKSFDSPETKMTADQHGYVVVIPEVHKNIKIGGKVYDVSHGTECRNLWNIIRNNPQQRAEFLTQLYGQSSAELAQIFDKIPQGTTEDISDSGTDTASPISGRVASLSEVAMNPSAFAQSIKQGQDKGVKVGFEFEVLIPADSVSGASSVAQFNPDDNSWIDGKTVKDLGAGSMRSSRGLKRILDDLVKNKRSVATELGTDSIWNAYFTWGNKQIEQEPDLNIAKNLINKIYAALKDPKVNQEVLSGNPEGENGLTKDVFVNKLAAAGIDVTGRRRIKPESLTSDQIATILEIGRTMYYRTTASDRVFGDMYRYIEQYLAEKRESYFGTYSGTTSDVAENFTKFCQSVYGTIDLKELLKTKWAFRGRTNNTTPVLKEKLWYYVTPGAPIPVSLSTQRNSSPTYKKGADFLKQNLQDVFGSTIEIFTNYHQATKKLDRWYIEPDGSLRPNPGDYSAEVVSPPLMANDAMNSLKTFYQKAQEMKLYTNSSTGLHINVSIPETLDVLKLALFAGDQYVLKTFGRENNSYARSVIKQLQGSNTGYSVNQFPDMEKELRSLAKNVSNDHFATVNFNGKYVSFRHAGGDYLNNMNEIINTVGRFIRAMIIASDPNAYRNEYINKILKLVQPAQSTGAQGLTSDELKELLTNGIPVVKFDVVLRPSFTDSAALVNGVKQFFFRQAGTADATATIQADPSAQQRLLASSGFGRPSREYLEQATANLFYTVTVLPLTARGFYKIKDVVQNNDGLQVARGVYNNSGDRFALSVGHAAVLTRKDPNFTKIFMALKGKSTTGPVGRLPMESLNEFAKDGFGDNSDNRSKILAAVKSLLDSGNKVDWLVSGQRGHVVRAQDDGITMKRYGMPRSKMQFFLPMNSDVRDNQYQIKLKAPKHYVVVNSYELEEDAAGVGVIAKNKKMAKDPRYSMSITKDVKPNTPKDMLRAFRLSEDNISKQDMMKMIKQFLPVAMKDLKIKRVPHIVLQPHIKEEGGQASFGRFVNEEEKIYLGIADRHPVDILRTLAHELVHFKQHENDEMYPGAGETGSPIENEAHWVAGIIMRHFNKKYPDAIKSKPLVLGNDQ
jgi:hypothetical protein